MKINLSDARFSGRNERIVGKDGYLNASSQKEALEAAVKLLTSINAGEIASDREVLDAEARSKILVEAFYDPTKQGMQEIASDIIAEITIRQERVGFMRNLLAKGNVGPNSLPRASIKQKNVNAVFVKGPVTIYPQPVRDDYVILDEFSISARPRISTKEINQGSPNLLDNKFYDAIEQTQVVEDRILIKAARKTAGVGNSRIAFTGELTPSIIRSTQTLVSDNGLPVTTIVMSEDLVKDLINTSFLQVIQYTPAQAELVATGRIGSLFGTEIITDAFGKNQNLRVLDKGELFAFSAPDNLGVYTDRGPVQSLPVEVLAEGTMTKGWDIFEEVAIFIANSLAVGYAKRA